MPMSFPEDVNLSAQEISKLYDELSTNLENMPFEELSPRYRMLLKAINDSTELSDNFKLLIKRLLDVSDLGKHFKRNMKSFFAKMAEEGDEMVPRSEPPDPAKYNFGTRTSNDSVNTEGLSKINNIKITKENKKMKISKQALTKLIKEELKEVLKEYMGYDPYEDYGYGQEESQPQMSPEDRKALVDKMKELQEDIFMAYTRFWNGSSTTNEEQIEKYDETVKLQKEYMDLIVKLGDKRRPYNPDMHKGGVDQIPRRFREFIKNQLKALQKGDENQLKALRGA